MKWYPFGESEEKPLENKMLWNSLARQGQESEGQTLVHCRYVSKDKYMNGGWVNIYKSTFLVNPDTESTQALVDPDKKDLLSMVQAFNVPVSPARHFFSQAGQLKQFTLLFPKLPTHWKRFHLLEIAESGGGFRVTDIARNDTGIYHVELT